MEQFMRLPAVLEVTGLTRSSLYRKAKDGEFPQPIKIGDRASAWLRSAVDAWIQGRIRAAEDGRAPTGRRNQNIRESMT
jgi:prophage regulatory protein